jgi:putative endonuclease
LPHVYLLRCRDGSLYTGVAKDLARRLAEHARGRASRYTRSRLPITLAWSRRVRTWRRALQEEHRIKALSRSQKDALVASGAGRGSAGRTAGALTGPRRP